MKYNIYNILYETSAAIYPKAVVASSNNRKAGKLLEKYVREHEERHPVGRLRIHDIIETGFHSDKEGVIYDRLMFEDGKLRKHLWNLCEPDM